MKEAKAGETRLAVPRRSATAGDELVAWGLARVISAVIGEDVVMRDDGSRLVIDVPLSREGLEWKISNPESLDPARLRWLESTGSGRMAPKGVATVDRDALREAERAVSAARSQSRADRAPGAADAIPLTTREDASRYPLYRVLTNPGTQWSGYNKVVEATALFTTAAGLGLLLDRYREVAPLGDAELEGRLEQFGVKKKNERRRNPPGFLFSGLNKGPTLPLVLEGGTSVGELSRSDPEMTDRGDLDLLALYLAYVGYFAVARVLEVGDDRTVLVPMPKRILVPRGLAVVERVRLSGSSNQDLLAARSALAYGGSVLGYLAELRVADNAEAELEGTVLHGVSLAQYWKPSNNTYAPIRTGFVPLPIWLRPIFLEDWELASGTIEIHERTLRSLRGAGPDRRLSGEQRTEFAADSQVPRRERLERETPLSGEQRTAFAAYRLSLDGGALDWFRTVCSWFPAIREFTRLKATFTPKPWEQSDVRRIAVALMPTLSDVIDDASFQAVAAAIRNATLTPHEELRRFRDGGKRGPKPLYSPEYDLISSLMSAADRSSTEFIGELSRFVAGYNDATIRPKLSQEEEVTRFRRAVVRDEDLRQVVRWVEEDRTGTVAAALLAFGTSRRGKTVGRSGGATGAGKTGSDTSPVDEDDLPEDESLTEEHDV